MYGDVGAVVSVADLPKCDFHRLYGQKVIAVYEGVTTEGIRAFMCSNCFIDYGIGLGSELGRVLTEDGISE